MNILKFNLPISTKIDYTNILESVSSYFGGYTLTQGLGGWFDEKNNKYYNEKINIIEIATEKEYFDTKSYLIQILKTFAQSEVALYLVYGDKAEVIYL